MKKLLGNSILLLGVLNFYSCIKEDVTNIEPGNNGLTPEYALPIGTIQLYVNKYLPDSSLIHEEPDSINSNINSLLYYGGDYYQNPFYTSYSVIQSFSLGSNATNLDSIISAMFRINAVNYIPTLIKIQVNFLDLNKNPMFSLFDTDTLQIPSAAFDANGNVIGSGDLWKKDYPLPSNRISQLGDVKYIQIYTGLEFPPPINDSILIPFYSTQNIWIQIGGKVKLKLAL
jgi:hypothetical protein